MEDLIRKRGLDMDKRGVLIGVVVLLLVTTLFIFSCAGQVASPREDVEQEFGIVQGRTRPPLENVEIIFTPYFQKSLDGPSVPNRSLIKTTTTNEEGKYSIELPVGHYNVEALPEQTSDYMSGGTFFIEITSGNITIKNFIFTPENSYYSYDTIVVYFNPNFTKENQRLLIRMYNSSIVDLSLNKSRSIYGNSTRVLVDQYIIEIPFDKTVEEMISIFNSSEGVLLVRKSYVTITVS